MLKIFVATAVVAVFGIVAVFVWPWYVVRRECRNPLDEPSATSTKLQDMRGGW